MSRTLSGSLFTDPVRGLRGAWSLRLPFGIQLCRRVDDLTLVRRGELDRQKRLLDVLLPVYRAALERRVVRSNIVLDRVAAAAQPIVEELTNVHLDA